MNAHRFTRRVSVDRRSARTGFTLIEPLDRIGVRQAFTLIEPFDRLRAQASRKHAFTLIELLVVIAIIAVLAAMFMPALKTAISTAKRVACAANLHGFGTAIHTYVGDRGHMPPIWERGWYDRPARDLAGRGRGWTLFGILREAGALPAEIIRCPADPRDYTPTEATFYQPIYMFGEDYSQPNNHRYSYGVIMSRWTSRDRRMPWSMPAGGVGTATNPHEGEFGYDLIPNPSILQIVWDAHIPIFTSAAGVAQMAGTGWPDRWDPEGLGFAQTTVFRHAQNDWVDWSQGPNALKADGHVEQWMNWENVRANLPDSEDWFSIPWSP